MKKNLKSIEKIYEFFLLHNLTAKLSKETNKLISIKKREYITYAYLLFLEIF